LPYLACTSESLNEFNILLSQYYTITVEQDPTLNPLYLATQDVEADLLLCPDALTNVTQLRPLLALSPTPFCVLQLRDGLEMVQSKPF
jgi:hypothetical protein